MTSSTSTLTTSNARPENIAPRLRAFELDVPCKLSAANEGDHRDIFFWTYTEEPHRTRRQAIIRAHPEVVCLIPLALARVDTIITGYQALWAGTIDQILRHSSRSAPSFVCISLAKHTNFLVAILPDGLHNWGHCEPKSLPCYS